MIRACRIASAIAMGLSMAVASTTGTYQYMLVAVALVCMTYLPDKYLAGNADLQLFRVAMWMDGIKNICLLLLMASTVMLIVRRQMGLDQVAFVIFAGYNMGLVSGRYRMVSAVIVSCIAVIGVMAPNPTLAISPEKTAVLGLSSGVYLLMTMMWRRLS